MNENQYDVIIVGAGPGGIFCAYELKEENPDLRVLLLEKGHSIEKRYCPKRKTKHCNNCHLWEERSLIFSAIRAPGT